MKFSEQWLREWVNPPLNTLQLAEQLTMAGLEIESVAPVAKEFNKVVIGLVNEVTQHPNADRLRVCKVDVGQVEPLMIVCGAANVRANLKVPVATVGAILPNDLKIQSSKLRGVVSQGMICSTSELGITETSEGIMELPDDAPVGEDFRQWLKLDDHVLDIHVTPNRGDCLSIAGVAREVAVLNNFDGIAPEIKAVTTSIKDELPITVLDAKDCPKYCGRIIRNVNVNAKTPVWMIERLRRSGIRNIHPIVDVTNYVLLELGQPLHAFDLAKLKDGIVVRLAKDKESITLLDGQTIELDAETLVIADQLKPQAVAGIMGGADSAVSTETKDIFLESAFFNPTTIAGRARRYGLDTDSAYRFERGVDANLPSQALERATKLLLDIVGGKPGPISEVVNKNYLPQRDIINLRLPRVAKVIGLEIPADQIEIILKRLGMQINKQNDIWQVTPPGHRFDLSIEEDLIEEIVRIYGYQKVPEKAPQSTLHFLPDSEAKTSLTRLRKLLVDRGYQEAITYSFVAPRLQQLIEPQRKFLSLQNPISADLSAMRTSLWPGLLSAVNYNQNRQQLRVRFFETGLRFLLEDHGVTQEAVIAGVITGSLVNEQWGVPQRQVDFFDLKGDVEALLKGKSLVFKPVEHSALHPGQSSAISLDGQTIGMMGALHPALVEQLDLQGPVYVFELQLDALTKGVLPQFTTISKFPAVRRDISFLIKQNITAQQILDLIKTNAGELLNDLSLFDVYQGKNVTEGFRSIALGLLWQHPARTLIDTEINDQMDKVVAALKDKFAITLRE